MAKTVVVILMLIWLIGCSPAEKTASVYVEPQCIASQSQCLVPTGLGQLRVLFNVENVTTEQEFKIIIRAEDLSEQLKITGYLTGKTMYMGKIPLFFSYDKQHQYYVSDVILGSCSEPQMIWTMQLSLFDDIKAQTPVQIMLIDFTSSRA